MSWKTTLSLAAMMLVGPGLAAPASAADDGNLVVNGSFEDANAQGHIDGWKGFRGHGVERIAEDGKHHVRIVSSEEQPGGWLQQDFAIPEGISHLLVTVRMRAFKVKVGEEKWNNPRVQLAQKNEAGETVGYGPVPHLTQDSDWTDLEIEYKLEPTATRLHVSIGLNDSTGILEVDDLKITPFDPAMRYTQPAPGEDGNMIPTGDFTDGKDGTPPHWKPVHPSLAEQVAFIEEDGNRFIRFTSVDLKKVPAISTEFAIPEGVKRIELSAKMRGKDLVVGEKGYQNPPVQLRFYNAEGEPLGYSRPIRLLEDTADWVTLTSQADLPVGTTRATVWRGSTARRAWRISMM